ncbi:EAL domain-containing protein [Acaryochloris sp. 'Moss Beach']|uniref:putative bifunctional diguanylate cyclase/phosphodiesterase n=1 Tax=Acaryochloris sp. 'Moss Beach' TaxID=2740837 RepID=UPI001F2B1C02|nr:GGDEF domain-containing response regulator [Acaryochloris sp. 'Moss Beach']UJB69250.1 EAL domain-containing protein [Acaryochloris sp. 'Moss Beach']
MSSLLSQQKRPAPVVSAKILVVEDEGLIALDIESHLIDLGYQVPGIAETGADAILLALEAQPDLVLMDIRLKGNIDGIQAAAKITDKLDIPIIFLTAFADADTLNKAKQVSPFGYILKPFDPMDLRTSIEIALHKHHFDQEVRQQKTWLHTILASIGDAVVATDNQGSVTYMNRVAESITQWQQAEALGKDVSDVIPLITGTAKNILENPLKQVLREHQEVVLPDNTYLITKNQEEIPIDDSAVPIVDDQNQSHGAVIVFRDITERLEANQQLFHHAYYDSLTNLPNRELFMDRLQHLINMSKRYVNHEFAVLFVDLDRFKMVNDSLGHPVGDKLLIATAQRLQKCLRPTDTVARFGGDEFAILLEQIADVNSVCTLAERINRELGAPYELGNYDLFNSASIGIVQSNIRYALAEELIRDADIAMYQAKTNGKGCYAVFDAVMHTQVKGQLTLENDLRRVITDQQLTLHYQPIVSLQDQEIVGFEALTRWEHPEKGLIPPGMFIPTAEETGLIVPLDLWAIREACQQLRKWQDQLPPERTLDVSVNLSSRHFSRPDLVQKIAAILAETKCPATSLKLEITESALIENPESAAQILSELKTLGLRIHIDDFGTGYSSLSYLHKYDIDTLKVDRSFIQYIDRNADRVEIVRTIVVLAHTLKMDVIAEGIESAEQLAAVQSLGCEYGQGYYFDRPLTSEQVDKLVREQAFKFCSE